MKTCDAPAFVLRRSPIHGTGVFAARAITPGEFVIEYKGERVTKAEARRRGLAREAAAGDAGRVYLFELNKRYDLDGDIPDNPAKYINHSCAENCQTVCERGHIRIYAIRAIASGEELTFDYGYAPEHFLGHPCR
ncbi:MAG: SET domain-containing protein-lysine N-methyltransferase, partial [Puniceicoccales bacterium]|nr:SET domain-containing protein-lysine N-methyltransferase [Puniceicoccales bacterium]